MASLRDDTPLQFVKGVGPVRAEQFNNLGLQTVGDLLAYLPFRYKTDLGDQEIADLRPGVTATIYGQVAALRNRPPGLTADLHDGTGICRLRWFQRPWGKLGFSVGAMISATGEVQTYDERIELLQPTVRLINSPTDLPEDRREPRLVGVYHANDQLKSSNIRRVVESIFANDDLELADPLPTELLRTRKLPDRAQALRQAHMPPDEKAAGHARQRLVYEEFLLLELRIALRRYRLRATHRAPQLRINDEVDRRIRARFPFPLTPSQEQVVAEIAVDLESGLPMSRLLQGDVGSGKTVVALYACLAAIANKRQAAIMAPTEILAEQHHANIERYLANSRVSFDLLRGKLNQRQRQEHLDAIRRGDIDLIVGTQALIQRDVAFRDLALVVVDEQHKFGVHQRATFRTKGNAPHYLVMTATPIPRTLAMTVFGDLDVSLLRDPPPGRGRTETRIIPRRKRSATYNEIARRLAKGEQAYIVCPLVGKDDPEDDTQQNESIRGAKVAATQVYDELRKGPLHDLPVGLLYGAMPPEQKSETINRFTRRDLAALVSTTVIEVGVDVPNATIMVVEQANQFGLAQLHQLRGRIGRGARDATCILLNYGAGRHGPAAQRLDVLAQTSDGFRIAEADLRQRGPGELLGSKQHGLPELRFGDLLADFQLLEQARDDAFAIIQRDPALNLPQHRLLRSALARQSKLETTPRTTA